MLIAGRSFCVTTFRSRRECFFFYLSFVVSFQHRAHWVKISRRNRLACEKHTKIVLTNKRRVYRQTLYAEGQSVMLSNISRGVRSECVWYVLRPIDYSHTLDTVFFVYSLSRRSKQCEYIVVGFDWASRVEWVIWGGGVVGHNPIRASLFGWRLKASTAATDVECI